MAATFLLRSLGVLLLAGIGVKALCSTVGPPGGKDNFVGSFRVELHRYNGTVEENASPTNYLCWMNKAMLLYKLVIPASSQPELRQLCDLRSDARWTLVNDDHGNRTAMKGRYVEATENTDTKDAPKAIRTAETRTIEGYTCVKMTATNKEGTWTAWVATELKDPYPNMVRTMEPQTAQRFAGQPAWDGFPLEYEWTSVTGERIVCQVKELVVGSVDEKLFDLEGYKTIELPMFGQ